MAKEKTKKKTIKKLEKSVRKAVKVGITDTIVEQTVADAMEKSVGRRTAKPKAAGLKARPAKKSITGKLAKKQASDPD